MKLRDIIALVLMFVVAVVGKGLGIWGDGAAPRRPVPQVPPPGVRDELPPGWKDDAGSSPVRPLLPAPVPGEIQVRVPKTVPSSGTAFSVDNRGHWLTARHVVDGCSDVLIVVGPRRAMRVARVYSHPNADVSVLATGRGAPPLAVMRSLGRARDGFQFGFPKGKPGAVYSTFIGATRLHSRGRYDTLEPSYAWAERIRVPSYEGSLGGLSGGPLLDRTGAVIGVVQAEAPRRGRIFSASPATLLAALDMAALSVPTVDGGRPDAADLNRTDFPHHGRELMRRLTVAKVVCRV